MSMLFNMLSRLVIAFLPRSKHLLISWLQSLSALILEPKKTKSVTVFIVFPSICHESMGPDAMILVFWMLILSQLFRSPLSLSSRGSSVLHFLPLLWCHLHVWGYWYFSRQSWFQLVLLPAWHFTWCTLHISDKISRVTHFTILGWSKGSFRFFCTMLWKTPMNFWPTQCFVTAIELTNTSPSQPESPPLRNGNTHKTPLTEVLWGFWIKPYTDGSSYSLRQ